MRRSTTSVFAAALALALLPDAAPTQDFSKAEVASTALSDADTLIVPGHGKVGDRAAVQACRDTLRTARDRIAKFEAAGRTREQVAAAAPTAEWDEVWGKGFIRPAQFVGFVYDSLPANGAARHGH